MTEKPESRYGKDLILLRKYFHKWLQNVTSEKDHGKKAQIANFLRRLVKEKEKLTKNEKPKNTKAVSNDNIESLPVSPSGPRNNYTTAVGNYLHRYQAQKNIIALQKAKLEEQKRFIEELKFNRIIKEVSSADTLNEVKSSLQQCSTSVKPKLKIVLGESASSESVSNDSLRVTSVKVPRFIQQMEQRARERQEKREIVMERKRQLELEREKLKEQLELEKQFLQQEELEKRMNEFKERRRQEQLLAIRRKQFREKMRALMVMADIHYEKKLYSKYGPSTWRLFLERVREDRLNAEHFDRQRIMRVHFYKWNRITQININERIQRADNLYNIKLKRDTFNAFKELHKEMIFNLQTAEDWYEVTITNTLFDNWRNNARALKVFRHSQWNLAVEHHNCQLKWKAIGCWQTLPTINTLERKQEARKQRWRLKVQQVIPDYVPKDLY